jgi:hypothetical protein
VYTPQVLLQGRDLRWRDAAASAALDRAAAVPARARVEVSFERAEGVLRVHAEARGADAALPADAVLVLAYVDSDLNSDVQAGENRGARLHHDHVVRALASRSRKEAAGLAADTTFTLPREAGREPAIVAFVQRTHDGAMLQAVALPLADCAPN